MSEPPGHSDPAFAGLSPAEYHQWRSQSELFNSIETKWFADFLKGGKPKRVLDLGCGTGISIGLLLVTHPQAEIVGIDLNSSMLEFARTIYHDRIRFVTAEAAIYIEPNPFDLIIAVLSADYIGFAGTAKAVASNLSRHGAAFIFFLDPNRYPLQKDQRVKSWVVSGRRIEAKIDNFDVSAAKAEFMQRGLIVEDHTHSFRLLDGIQRLAHCFECRRP